MNKEKLIKVNSIILYLHHNGDTSFKNALPIHNDVIEEICLLDDVVLVIGDKADYELPEFELNELDIILNNLPKY